MSPGRGVALAADRRGDRKPASRPPGASRPESAELARFRDLYAYVRAYAAPDRRVDDGARFVAAAGEWAGRELLGEPSAQRSRQRPGYGTGDGAGRLGPVLLWPLELAT